MYRALIVCNSRFPDDPGVLSELQGPKVDGVVLRDALLHQDAGMFEKDDIRSINEGDSLEVSCGIEDFFGAAEPDDTLFFFYSGHGRSRSQQLFLCARNTVVDRLHSTAISEATLNGIVSESFAQVKILIFDCCFSGLFKGSELVDGMAGAGRYIIAAASATDRASDSKLRGLPSPFTAVLADALVSRAADRDGDGIVDLDDLFSYMSSTPYDGPRPQRNFDGSGAVPIARRGSRPVNRGIVQAPGAGIGYPVPVNAVFLDTLAPDASINTGKVADFRQLMREDIGRLMPRELTSAEFMQRAGLFRNGSPTYAGVLLFGDYPAVTLPSAIVQCTRFQGPDKNAPFQTVDIQDTVPAMIVGARDFVAGFARLGDLPTAAGAYAEPTYGYPMIAVREIIANAVVHRDYEAHGSCVQVHVFTDRIEVISPGTWGTAPTVAGFHHSLGELERPSDKRNFRLAHTLTWSKLVEGVGAGIPRALADCRASGAEEPVVSMRDAMVTVTIFPSPPRLALVTNSRLSQSSPSPADVSSENPVFFFSYASARSPGRQAANLVKRFFDDLSQDVAQLTALRQGTWPGFIDLGLPGGTKWDRELLTALGTCQVFVPLLSVPYFDSEWCGKEWHAFARRTTSGVGERTIQANIVPVCWTPVPDGMLPEPVRSISRFTPSDKPDQELPASYEENGLYGLMRTDKVDAYEIVVWQLAQHIAKLYREHRIGPIVSKPGDLVNVFHQVQG